MQLNCVRYGVYQVENADNADPRESGYVGKPLTLLQLSPYNTVVTEHHRMLHGNVDIGATNVMD